MAHVDPTRPEPVLEVARLADGLHPRAPYDNGDRGAFNVGDAVLTAVLVLLVLLIVGVL